MSLCWLNCGPELSRSFLQVSKSNLSLSDPEKFTKLQKAPEPFNFQEFPTFFSFREERKNFSATDSKLTDPEKASRNTGITPRRNFPFANHKAVGGVIFIAPSMPSGGGMGKKRDFLMALSKLHNYMAVHY